METRQGGQQGRGSQGERLLKGRTLAERRQERREALLAAALEVFGTKGYGLSSVEEICRRAYVSSRNFYEEFDNRAALFCELNEQIATRVYEALSGVEEEPGPDPVRRRTRARVAALVHSLVDDPRVARVALFESIGVSPEGESRRRRAHHRYASWIHDYVREELEANGIHDEQRQYAFALALVGAGNELMSEWILLPPEERFSVEELIEIITDLAMVILQR